MSQHNALIGQHCPTMHKRPASCVMRYQLANAALHWSTRGPDSGMVSIQFRNMSVPSVLTKIAEKSRDNHFFWSPANIQCCLLKKLNQTWNQFVQLSFLFNMFVRTVWRWSKHPLYIHLFLYLCVHAVLLRLRNICIRCYDTGCVLSPPLINFRDERSDDLTGKETDVQFTAN